MEIEEVFHRVNNNTIVSMYTGIIDNLLYNNEKSHLSSIKKMVNDMRNVDKSVLNDKNLGRLEGLQFLFNKCDITENIVNDEFTTVTYKKNFLDMINRVYKHKLYHEKNLKDGLDEFNDKVDYLYTLFNDAKIYQKYEKDRINLYK